MSLHARGAIWQQRHSRQHGGYPALNLSASAPSSPVADRRHAKFSPHSGTMLKNPSTPGRRTRNRSARRRRRQSAKPPSLSPHRRRGGDDGDTIAKERIKIVGPTCSLYVSVSNESKTKHLEPIPDAGTLKRIFEGFGDLYNSSSGRRFGFVNFRKVEAAERAKRELGNARWSSVSHAYEDPTDAADSELMVLHLSWSLPPQDHPLHAEMQLKQRESSDSVSSTDNGAEVIDLRTRTVGSGGQKADSTERGALGEVHDMAVGKEVISGRGTQERAQKRPLTRLSLTLAKTGTRQRHRKAKRWADIADSDDSDDSDDDSDEESNAHTVATIVLPKPSSTAVGAAKEVVNLVLELVDVRAFREDFDQFLLVVDENDDGWAQFNQERLCSRSNSPNMTTVTVTVN